MRRGKIERVVSTSNTWWQRTVSLLPERCVSDKNRDRYDWRKMKTMDSEREFTVECLKVLCGGRACGCPDGPPDAVDCGCS